MMPVTGHQANRPFANCCHPLCFQQSIDSRAQMTLSCSIACSPASQHWLLGHSHVAIRDKKLETESVLTVGLPPEFDVFYKYVRALEFEDLPDYEGLRVLFRGLA